MGGYIILRVTSGFTDAISLLWYHGIYAKLHNRTIIFCLDAYKATDLESLIDFSAFPVRVLCGEKHIKNISFSRIEPTCFGNDPYKKCNSIVQEGQYNVPSIGNMITRYDQTQSYPEDILLIFQGIGNFGKALEVLKHIKFKPAFLEKFYKQRNMFNTFVAIHLRATDYPGYKEEEDIAKVDMFVAKYPKQPIYLACDNPALTEKLCSKHNNIAKPLSYKKIEKSYYSMHYSFGNVDPECLTNAIIDILMCASGTDFLQSCGGFSRLISNIRNTPGLLEKLT
jgi:hypothetical protein